MVFAEKKIKGNLLFFALERRMNELQRILKNTNTFPLKWISMNLPNRELLLFLTVFALPNASNNGFAGDGKRIKDIRLLQNKLQQMRISFTKIELKIICF